MTAAPAPRDVLSSAPRTGEPPSLLGRETGFALKLHAPPLVTDSLSPGPPGQGQILICLRGRARVREFGGAEGRVVSTSRPEQGEVLEPGQLFRVANDARWTLGALEEGSLLLALSTSVPREGERSTDILALARKRPHMAPFRLFGNEVVTLEFSAARGSLPFRGWVPWSHRAAGVEYAFILQGTFAARLELEARPKERLELPAGSLLRIPPGLGHRFRAAGRGLCVGLVISGRAGKAAEEVSREDARGFTPFTP